MRTKKKIIKKETINVLYSHKNDKKEKKSSETEIILKELEKTYLTLKNDNNINNHISHNCKEWQNMFEIVVDYTESLIKKFLRTKLYLPLNKIKEYAIDATILLMKKYKEQEDFKINTSFGGFLKWKILEVLYNTKNQYEDNEYSLNYILEKNNKRTELLNTVANNDIYFDDKDNANNKQLFFDKKKFSYIFKSFEFRDLLEVINTLLKEYSIELLSQKKYKLVLLGYLIVLLFLRKPFQKLSITNFLEKQNLSFEEKNVLELLLLELKKRYEDYFKE